MAAQRVFGIALGYEDLIIVTCAMTGAGEPLLQEHAQAARARACGTEPLPQERPDPDAIDGLFVDLFLRGAQDATQEERSRSRCDRRFVAAGGHLLGWGAGPQPRSDRAIGRSPQERAQRNFSDPDSRVLKTRDGFVQGYNCQLAVDAAHLFFQLVSRRYERGSMLITSNRAIGEWGMVFGDPVVATAILDRLLHYSHVVTIRGDSYRLREKRRSGLLKAATEPREPAPGA